MGLGGEDGLRFSRGAHKAARDGVGIHLEPFNVHVGYLIGPACLRSSAQVYGGDGLEAAVGAAVKNYPCLMRHHGAISLDPGFELDNRRMAGIARRQLLDVVHDHPHRAASTPRQKIGQGDVHG